MTLLKRFFFFIDIPDIEGEFEIFKGDNSFAYHYLEDNDWYLYFHGYLVAILRESICHVEWRLYNLENLEILTDVVRAFKNVLPPLVYEKLINHWVWSGGVIESTL